MIKVTFDTNTFDKAVRPHVYAKDPDHGDFVKVHEAVKDGRIKGFLCDAIVTLEGIKVDDRAEVFGSKTRGSSLRRCHSALRAPADCDHRFQLIATKRSD